MTEQPIPAQFVDGHVHLIDRRRLKYPWLDVIDPKLVSFMGDYRALQREYLIDDFIRDSAAAGLAKFVHVQAAEGHGMPVEETEWIQSIADRISIPVAIVGHVDLCAEDAEQILEGHCTYPGFRGVRMIGGIQAAASGAFDRGFNKLAARGLIYDVDATWESFNVVGQLANKYPQTLIVLEHTGIPRKQDNDYTENWRRGVQMLSAIPNIVAKISGLGMSLHVTTDNAMRPYVLDIIDAFGTTRSFFGTNWPVDSLYGGSYTDLVTAFRTIISEFSETEQQDLLCKNVQRIYDF